MALAEIARHANSKTLTTRIFYEGNIGHQENRTFVNLLDIKMEHLTQEALQKCTYLAMVDCSGPGANNDVPPQTKIQIIIDHHKDGNHIAGQGTVYGHPAVDRGDCKYHDAVSSGTRYPGR